eukprot:4827314-Prymnesium_polylepis.1
MSAAAARPLLSAATGTRSSVPGVPLEWRPPRRRRVRRTATSSARPFTSQTLEESQSQRAPQIC